MCNSDDDPRGLKRKIESLEPTYLTFTFMSPSFYLQLVSIIASFGQLLHQVSTEERNCVRQLENASKKLSNAENAVVFNDVCIRENLLPKYSNIYIYIYFVKHDSIFSVTQFLGCIFKVSYV